MEADALSASLSPGRSEEREDNSERQRDALPDNGCKRGVHPRHRGGALQGGLLPARRPVRQRRRRKVYSGLHQGGDRVVPCTTPQIAQI